MPSIEYLAGYFDGEGCVTVYTGPSHKNAPLLSLHVTSGDEGVIKAFHEVFGGSFVVEKARHCTRRQLYRWRCSGSLAIKTLEVLVPFLIAKRHPTELALQMNYPVRHYGRGHKLPEEELVLRKELATQIKQFNQRVTIAN